jgi:hypothetical protein
MRWGKRCKGKLTSIRVKSHPKPVKTSNLDKKLNNNPVDKSFLFFRAPSHSCIMVLNKLKESIGESSVGFDPLERTMDGEVGNRTARPFLGTSVAEAERSDAI